MPKNICQNKSSNFRFRHRFLRGICKTFLPTANYHRERWRKLLKPLRTLKSFVERTGLRIQPKLAKLCKRQNNYYCRGSTKQVPDLLSTSWYKDFEFCDNVRKRQTTSLRDEVIDSLVNSQFILVRQTVNTNITNSANNVFGHKGEQDSFNSKINYSEATKQLELNFTRTPIMMSRTQKGSRNKFNKIMSYNNLSPKIWRTIPSLPDTSDVGFKNNRANHVNDYVKLPLSSLNHDISSLDCDSPSEPINSAPNQPNPPIKVSADIGLNTSFDSIISAVEEMSMCDNQLSITTTNSPNEGSSDETYLLKRANKIFTDTVRMCLDNVAFFDHTYYDGNQCNFDASSEKSDYPGQQFSSFGEPDCPSQRLDSFYKPDCPGQRLDSFHVPDCPGQQQLDSFYEPDCPNQQLDSFGEPGSQGTSDYYYISYENTLRAQQSPWWYTTHYEQITGETIII